MPFTSLYHIADETTIHGVKDAVYATRTTKILWLLVFLGSLTAMAFQLHQVFDSYAKQETGTSVKYGTQESMVDLPSYYVCPPVWVEVTNVTKAEDIQKSVVAELAVDSLFQPTLDDKVNYDKLGWAVNHVESFEESLYKVMVEDLPTISRQPYEYIKNLSIDYNAVQLLGGHVDYTKHLALNAHGVCFELRPHASKINREQAWKTKATILLRHREASADQLMKFKILAGPQGNKDLYYTNMAALTTSQTNSWLHDLATDSEQLRLELRSKGIRVDTRSSSQGDNSYSLHELSFSPRMTSRLYTRNNPCKAWSQVDQAKCNVARQKPQAGECHSYLPPSQRTKGDGFDLEQTCVFDRGMTSGYASDTPSDDSMFQQIGKTIQKLVFSNRSLEENIAGLLTNSWQCPQPCETTEYQLRSSSVTDTFFKEAIRKAQETKDGIAFKAFIATLELQVDHGVKIEEYLIVTLPGLLSNLGGTMGLFLGASVISIIQLAFLLLGPNGRSDVEQGVGKG